MRFVEHAITTVLIVPILRSIKQNGAYAVQKLKTSHTFLQACSWLYGFAIEITKFTGNY